VHQKISLTSNNTSKIWQHTRIFLQKPTRTPEKQVPALNKFVSYFADMIRQNIGAQAPARKCKKNLNL